MLAPVPGHCYLADMGDGYYNVRLRMIGENVGLMQYSNCYKVNVDHPTVRR